MKNIIETLEMFDKLFSFLNKKFGGMSGWPNCPALKEKIDKAIAEAEQIEEEQKVYTITENKATLPPLKTFVLAYIQGIEDPKLVRINNIDYLEWTYPGWGYSVSFGDQWQYLPKRKSNEPENN